ncbi:MAG: formate/nitrite transporter family protein [Candidatus Binataceae bacterium]
MRRDDEEKEPVVPTLSEEEKKTVIERTAPRAAVLHEAIREEGEIELRRPVSALVWSGLAAGGSMGFSLASEGLLQAYLPNAPWRHLVVTLGYTVGFLAVVLGRQQLFTENTVTVMLPLLSRRTVRALLQVLRLWAIVLAANLLGACGFAWLVGNTGIFTPEVRAAFAEIGKAAATGAWEAIFLRAIFAGWIIAMMVWMLPSTEGAGTAVIIIMTYLVGLGDFSHVVAGSVEVLYVVVTSGDISWAGYFGQYLAPTLLGNVVGGVALVAFVNHAQVITEEAQSPQ